MADHGLSRKDSAPSLWRVTWKRGEKMSGRTPQVPADGERRVRFTVGNEARFASTIQRRGDGTSLHKKLVEFVVTELRPR
eukprot:gene20353-41709_t